MTPEDINRYRLILASGSPRRQQLLEGLGLRFEVTGGADVEENHPEGLTREEIPAILAELKSAHAMEGIPPDTILITADTIVWHRDRVLGKPADRSQAEDILRELSGSVHEVLTGVCLRSIHRKKVFTSSSLVWFANLTEDEIRYYLEKFRPFDKAGAYGIQEWIGFAGVSRIEGSHFNVMGLPVQELYSELKALVAGGL